MLEALYISKCLNLIEQRINRGSSQDWTYGDFKFLQKAIFEACSVRLSTYTLERLYGKLKVHKDYNPQIETKNALAMFLGYKDWEDFKNHNPLQPKQTIEVFDPIVADTEIKQSEPTPNVFHKNRPGKMPIILGAVCILVVAIGLVALVNHKSHPTTPIFRTEDAHGKPPHTVKFVYDISGQEGDSFFLWVPEFGETYKLSKAKKFIYRAYFQPGWYRAHLLKGKDIIAEALFSIGTPGWTVKGTSYDNRHLPYWWFLPQNAVASNGRLYTPDSLLHDSIRKKAGYYFLSYFNVRKFNVEGDNVAFETRFRNNSRLENAACNDMWFKLVGLNGILDMHFLYTGCTGFIKMTFGDKVFSGLEQSLPQFGVNMYTWKKARLEVKNKKVSIYLDGALIFQTSYSNSVGPIVGIDVTSRSNAETDYIKLFDANNKLVYEDDFGGEASD